MDELNKNQVVLLTLLVSFVTSIATGIVTVTLIQQAPPAVTQTINRVVERTIEKTVPGETKTQTVIKEVPVIVTEEQLIVDVINAASPATVRISDSAGKTIGSGFLVSDDGLIASASHLLLSPIPAGADFQISLSKSRTAKARLLSAGVDRGVAIFKLDLASLKDADGSADSKTGLAKLDLVSSETLPGQTVVALGVPDNGPLTVSGGIVSGLFTNTASSTAFISTSAANQNNLGGPVLNTKGKVIGLSAETGLALTAKMVNETLEALVK